MFVIVEWLFGIGRPPDREREGRKHNGEMGQVATPRSSSPKFARWADDGKEEDKAIFLVLWPLMKKSN